MRLIHEIQIGADDRFQDGHRSTPILGAIGDFQDLGVLLGADLQRLGKLIRRRPLGPLWVGRFQLIDGPLQDSFPGDKSNVGRHEVRPVVVPSGEGVTQRMDQDAGPRLINKIAREVIDRSKQIRQTQAYDQ